MPAYNLYRLTTAAQRALKTRLKAAGYVVLGRKKVGTTRLALWVTKKPRKVPVPWLALYADFVPSGIALTNRSHAAVFLVSARGVGYAIPYGTAHVHVRPLASDAFGMDLAERIVSVDDVSLKHSRLFGGTRRQAVTAYRSNASLEIDDAEALAFLRARTSDAAKWGRTGEFGGSARLMLRKRPVDLPGVLVDIESKLREKPIHKFPRVRRIDDASKLAALDARLGASIATGHDVGISPVSLRGVDFEFLSAASHDLAFGGRRSKLEEDLSLEALVAFASSHGCDLAKQLDRIRVISVAPDGTRVARGIRSYLDTVLDDRYCLIDGHWYEFNQDYVDHLRSAVQAINTEPGDPLSATALDAWKRSLPRGTKLTYPEHYFNGLRAAEGYCGFQKF